MFSSKPVLVCDGNKSLDKYRQFSKYIFLKYTGRWKGKWQFIEKAQEGPSVVSRNFCRAGGQVGLMGRPEGKVGKEWLHLNILWGGCS